MNNGPPILLLDSNALEAETLQQALTEVSMDCPVVHCSDSQKAMEYLVEGFGERPWLILMNCYASGMFGLDFLKWLKSDDDFQVIPAIALADSQKEHFVDACFSLGAVGYIIKSDEYQKLKKDMSIALQYWSLSRLPSGASFSLNA
jgi:CheY-like chemotaxis protein